MFNAPTDILITHQVAKALNEKLEFAEKIENLNLYISSENLKSKK